MEKIPFDPFGQAVAQQFALMQAPGNILAVMDINPDAVWDKYLSSFPQLTDPIFRNRFHYDCNCCKQFIRQIGNVVAINSQGIQTIWDITVDGYHQDVADELAALIRSGNLKDYYLCPKSTVGTKASVDFHDNRITWKHFFTPIPKDYIAKEEKIPSMLGEVRTTKEMFARSMTEFHYAAAEAVLELIAAGLHRGPEYKQAVLGFMKLKEQYDKITDPVKRENFIWMTSKTEGIKCRISGSVIGTLLKDISEGLVSMDVAVNKFEDKVSDGKFKRTTALASPKAIAAAAKELADRGLKDSLYRQFATPEQISVNNKLFSVKVEKPMDVFGDLLAEAKAKAPKVIEGTTDVSLDKFLTDILPLAHSIELLFENRLTPNLMSLIAPAHPDVPNFFQWNNNFSWAYKGDAAGSLREKVHSLGGRVDGVLRFSHTWNYDPSNPNQSLMDLHVFLPTETGLKDYEGKEEIHDRCHTTNAVNWTNRKHHATGGSQDLDFVNEPGTSVPVENITFPDIRKMPEGKYVFKIHNWNLRNPTKSGFQAEIEVNGQVYKYEMARALKHKEWITLAEVTLKNGQFTIEHKLESSSSSKKVWNISTHTWVPVNMITKSPNYWDGQSEGHRHTFFILEGCKNDEPARGFFNEFLQKDLSHLHKVFEMLGEKTMAKPTDNQVSGLGFSSTKSENVTVRVTGKTTRTFNIKF